MSPAHSPHLTIRELLEALTHDPDGKPDLRRAAAARAAASAGGHIDAEGATVPDPLGAWVDAVATRAWQTTDEDMDRLRAAGVDEDTIYEATVAAAVGAAYARLQVGLRALAESEPAGAAAGAR